MIWPLLQPQHPEAAGVCLSIGRAASLVPWQPSLFVGTTGGLWCSWFWLLYHRGAGSLNRVTFGAAPSAVGQSFFGTNWRVAVFVRLAASSPSPRKVALKRWTEGYLPPGNPLFFAETDVRFRGIVLVHYKCSRARLQFRRLSRAVGTREPSATYPRNRNTRLSVCFQHCRKARLRRACERA